MRHIKAQNLMTEYGIEALSLSYICLHELKSQQHILIVNDVYIRL